MRPTREGGPTPSRRGLVYVGVGVDPGIPTTDPSPPTDLAELGQAFVPFTSLGNVAIAQYKTGVSVGGGAPITVTLDAAPTIGNLLVLCISVDDDGGPTFTIDNGTWTQVGSTVFSGNSTNWPNRMYRQVVNGSTSAITNIDSTAGSTDTGTLKVAVLELSGVDTLDADTGSASNTSTTTDSVTPSAGLPAIIVSATFGRNAGGPVLAPAGSMTELAELLDGGGNRPYAINTQSISSTTGSYTVGSTGASANSSMIAGVFEDTGDAIFWINAPLTIDGNDATYNYAYDTGIEAFWRADLGDTFLVDSIEARLAFETAGSNPVIVQGANLADFSDAVTVATIPVTATGSFTAQDISDSWTPTNVYRYWQLVETTEDDVRIHEVHLFAADTSAGGVTSHPALTERDDPDQHPATAVSVDTTGFAHSTGDDAQEVFADLDAAIGSGGLQWFNVVDYGAVGDGSTDDTAEINAAIAALNTATRGVLYFPAGSYLCSSALTAITANGTILGDGMTGTYAGTSDTASELLCSSGSANFLTFGEGVIVRGLALRNTAGSVTAGYGIGGTNMNLCRFEDVSVTGFWVNFKIDGGLWGASRCYSRQSHKYGFQISYAAVPDGGDWTMTDCQAVDGANSSDAAVYVTSGGGGKIINLKVNSSTSVGFGTGIDVAIGAGADSSVLLIANCSIENIRAGDAVRVTTTSTGKYGLIAINGLQVGLYSNNAGRAVKLTAATNGPHTSAGALGTITIDGGVFHTDGTARAAVQLTNTDRVWLGDYQLSGFNARYTASGDTNTTDASSPSFATPSIVLGTAAAAGSAATVIRSDSTIVAFDATVPVTQAFGDAAATGSAAVASRRDHRHGMPAAAGIGPILIADTHSTPLVFADLIQNEAQDDLVYADP